MIDLACVFTTGGVLLFQITFCQLKFDFLTRIIQDRLIKEKSADVSYNLNPYVAKWKIANEFNLVFCIVYQELFQLQFVEDLLDIFKNNFIKFADNYLKGNVLLLPDFKSEFEMSYEKWQANLLSQQKQDKQMRSFAETKKGQKILELKQPDEKQETIEKVKQKSVKEILQQKFGEKKIVKPQAEQSEQPTTTEKKRDWGIQQVSSQKMKELDVKKSHLEVQQAQTTYFESSKEDLEILKQFDDPDEDDDKPKGLFSKLSSKIKSYTGNKVIEEEDLQTILDTLKVQLMTKNVAEEIAQSLIESLKQSLVAKKTKAFTSIQSTVKESFKVCLQNIMTSVDCPDIVQKALESKDKGKPFVMTFIGVNGVGKSTNLAKVAYMLKNQGFSVMLVACDNFRAGAIEQIKQHGKNLSIPVYDRGYKEDPPEIAHQAIKEAQQKKIDCVLIDTAGRMQNNSRLMSALARLVKINEPDLVLFIGEALAGNDAIDQLQSFNKSLVDHANRQIDGIILSKFDTVDDKGQILIIQVGAAISMTYCTGKPIFFVGVGQKYPHLRKLNVKTAVNALLS